MNKSLTITFFGFSPLTYGGGYETYVMKAIEKLSENGYKINIVTGDQKINDYIHILLFHKLMEKRISKGEILKRLPSVEIYEYGIDSFSHISKSFKHIRKIMINSDIIYTRNEIIDFLIINHFCRKYCPAIVCGIHTSIYYPHRKSFTSRLHNFLYKTPLYGKLLNNCSVILPQNKYDTEILTSEYNIKKEKIIKLLPFVDINFFDQKNFKRDDNKFKILFVGRLTEQKGIDILYKSIEDMSNLPEFNDMIFTITGSGELEYMIKDLISKHDNVRFLGFVSDRKLIELYNSNDIIVLPSRWETALKIVLEAQSCGLPVIVSNIPGPNELIIPNETGFLIEPESYTDLSDKILRIFKLKKYDKENYIAMRQKSIKNADIYSIDKIIIELENIFKETINERKKQLFGV